MHTENLVIESSLPADPDNQNNDRAYWAKVALNAFARITGMSSADEDEENILSDLLCNLMHLCDRLDIDFSAALLGAKHDYRAETCE